jgi:hypothetical protein
MNVSERKNVYKSLAEDMTGRGNSGELGVDGRMMLLLAERS